MNEGINIETMRKLKSRHERNRYLLKYQQQWIDLCKQRGSYTGSNGPAIKQADKQQLQELEAECHATIPRRLGIQND